MQLHFREYGGGTPLIILHGLFGSLRNWHTVSHQLSSNYHVFAIDQRNHGESPHAAEMDYPVMAEDLREFAETHSLRTAHVLGHSMGGKMAMRFALSYPERVEKLVVVDIAPRAYASAHENIFKALRALDLKSLQSRGEADHALAGWIPERSVRQFLLKNLHRTANDGFEWKLGLENISRNYPLLRVAIESPRPFTKPALFVCGAESDYIRDEDRPAIKRLFPSAEFRTVPDVGHWVHAVAPDAFVEIVREFLK